MKALSIQQPWAWAILHAGKDIENRTWRTNVRGRILIHASKTYDFDGHNWIEKEFGIVIPANCVIAKLRGGIVGSVEITDCVRATNSKWYAQGTYGFVLENPVVLPFIPCRGRLGFFDVNINVT